MSDLYAIVDTAQDSRLYGWVLATQDNRCLFAGKLEAPLAAAAPYLVKLTSESPLYKAWQREGWGRNWGIFIQSRQSIAPLYRHFRQFLLARMDDGTIALFRYYDPRVWHAYIKACDADDLRSWFEPVERFIVEAADAGGSVNYRLCNGQLVAATA